MRSLCLLLLVSSLEGCAGGAAAFHTWVVAHQATLIDTALVAGAASQAEGVYLNTKAILTPPPAK